VFVEEWIEQAVPSNHLPHRMQERTYHHCKQHASGSERARGAQHLFHLEGQVCGARHGCRHNLVCGQCHLGGWDRESRVAFA